jgi:hypothetical protein
VAVAESLHGDETYLSRKLKRYNNARNGIRRMSIFLSRRFVAFVSKEAWSSSVCACSNSAISDFFGVSLRLESDISEVLISKAIFGKI